MNEQKHNRGNESKDKHLLPKCEVLHFLHSFGYGTALCELECCDIVAVHPICGKAIGIEFENSNRNALRNLTRDFANGCSEVLIVCPDFKTLGEVARKLTRVLPHELWPRLSLATLSALRLTQPHRFPLHPETIPELPAMAHEGSCKTGIDERKYEQQRVNSLQPTIARKKLYD
ncbi:MAG: hypothetical protein ACXWJX_14150 [Limisphaerales bacterium]